MVLEPTMKQITLPDDDTSVSKFISDVRALGEEVVIVSNGEEIARIVPLEIKSERQKRHEAAIQRIQQLRKTLPPVSLEEIQAMIREGRRE